MKTDEEIYTIGERVINNILHKSSKKKEKKDWKSEEERIEAFKQKYGITDKFFRNFPVNSWSWEDAKKSDSFYRETYWTEGKVVERDVPEGDHTCHRHILEDCSWIMVESRNGVSFFTSSDDMQEIEDALKDSKVIKQYFNHLETKDYLGIKRLLYFEDGEEIAVYINDCEYPLDSWDIHDCVSDGKVFVIKSNEDDFENTSIIACKNGSFLSFYVGEDRFVCSNNRNLFTLEEKLLSGEDEETDTMVTSVSSLTRTVKVERRYGVNRRKRLVFSRSELMKIRALKTKYNISEIHWEKAINEMMYTTHKNYTHYNYWTDGTLIEGEPEAQSLGILALKDAKWVIFEGKDETHLYTVAKDYDSLEEALNSSEKAKEYLAHLDFKNRLRISRIEYYNKGKLFELRIGTEEYSSSEFSGYYSDGTLFYEFNNERENAHYISMVDGTWFMFSVGESKILCTEIRDLKAMEEKITKAKEIKPRYVSY